MAEINQKYLGETVEVLFEDKVKSRWRGRTPTNKIVFVETEENLRGKLLPVTVTWTGPWSMQAVLKVISALISIINVRQSLFKSDCHLFSMA